MHDETHSELGSIDLRRSRLPPTSEVPQAYSMAPPLGLTNPPQVTISGVTGHTSSGLGHAFESQLQKSRVLGSHPSLGGGPTTTASQQDCLHILTTRPWRSNSLTPPGCMTQQEWQPTSAFVPQSPKGRSNSLSFDNHANIFCMGGHGGGENSSAEDEKIDEIIRGLPEGSGMRGKTSFRHLLDTNKPD